MRNISCITSIIIIMAIITYFHIFIVIFMHDTSGYVFRSIIIIILYPQYAQ